MFYSKSDRNEASPSISPWDVKSVYITVCRECPKHGQQPPSVNIQPVKLFLGPFIIILQNTIMIA